MKTAIFLSAVAINVVLPGSGYFFAAGWAALTTATAFAFDAFLDSKSWDEIAIAAAIGAVGEALGGFGGHALGESVSKLPALAGKFTETGIVMLTEGMVGWGIKEYILLCLHVSPEWKSRNLVAYSTFCMGFNIGYVRGLQYNSPSNADGNNVNNGGKEPALKKGQT